MLLITTTGLYYCVLLPRILLLWHTALLSWIISIGYICSFTGVFFVNACFWMHYPHTVAIGCAPQLAIQADFPYGKLSSSWYQSCNDFFPVCMCAQSVSLSSICACKMKVCNAQYLPSLSHVFLKTWTTSDASDAAFSGLVYLRIGGRETSCWAISWY